MLEFLLEHPIVLLLLIVALSRVLKRKKSGTDAPVPAAKADATLEARRRAEARSIGQAGGPMSLEKRIEQLALDLQAKLENTTSPAIRTAPAEPTAAIGEPRPLPSAATGVTLAAAALESGALTPREIIPPEIVLERPGPVERTDYDRRAEAFSYHSAIEEPEARAYHLDSFATFHSVSGERTGGRAEGGALETIDAATGGLFSSEEDVRRAFILGEVLGRPRALRALSSR